MLLPLAISPKHVFSSLVADKITGILYCNLPDNPFNNTRLEGQAMSYFCTSWYFQPDLQSWAGVNKWTITIISLCCFVVFIFFSFNSIFLVLIKNCNHCNYVLPSAVLFKTMLVLSWFFLQYMPCTWQLGGPNETSSGTDLLMCTLYDNQYLLNVTMSGYGPRVNFT